MSHRVTPWERYMAADHGPRHSMTCFSRFWLSQPVAEAAFKCAVAEVAAANPFLAVHRRGRSWSPVAFDAARQIDWSDAAAPASMRHQVPDDMLVYWTVRVGRLGDLGVADQRLADVQGTLVVLRYPHAVADGLAATAVTRQVCDVIAGRTPTLPTRRDLDERLTLGRTARTSRRRLRHEVKRIAKFFTELPTGFAPAGRCSPMTGLSEIVCERFSAAATRPLLEKARAVGVTLNDVLVAALFRALAAHMRPRAVIRIAVPVSLRARDNRAFCNQVSMVFLDRVAGRVGDASLLRGVSGEMAHVKRWNLGHAMHSFLMLTRSMSDVVLRVLARQPFATTTAVLSNLGDPYGSADEVAALRVMAHDLLSPLRPGTNVAISAVGHDGRLALTARYAPERISADQARQLLERTFAEAVAMLDAEPTPA